MQCVQAMPAGVGQWVWVSDFKGFGLSDCDPRLAKVFLDLSAEHYPERLGLFLIVDAPWSVILFCLSCLMSHAMSNGNQKHTNTNKIILTVHTKQSSHNSAAKAECTAG